MQLSSKVVDLIKVRTSWRSYKPVEIEPEKLAKLRTFMQSLSTGPFGGHARFELIELKNVDPNEVKKLGTYGVVKGARYFIVGVMQPATMDREDFGYLFEEIVLFATDLGLGTVWLGGTFKRSEFAQQMHLTGDESLPAICPVGYITDKRGRVDSLVRRVVKASSRKPWETIFFSGNCSTPLSLSGAEPFSVPLEMVRRAPSAGNGQPWRVVKEVDSPAFHFYIQPKYQGKDGGKLAEYARIDCGIAMCHFALTAQEMRLPGTWRVKDPNITPLLPNCKYVASWVPT